MRCKGQGAWSKEQGARSKEQGAGGREHGAWEGRALRNDPVGHFSEGACLQGRQGSRSKDQGAWIMEHGAKGMGEV
jgi:hypothetical protein